MSVFYRLAIDVAPVPNCKTLLNSLSCQNGAGNQMPLAPNAVERLLFLTLNQAPGPVLDLWSGPAFRMVLAAIRLNVFETLATEPATADNLAQRLNANPRGMRILLETLVGLGYLTQRNGTFSLTQMTRKWLTDAGDINFSPFFQYWGIILEKFFPMLEESIRSGQPPVNFYEWIETQPETSRHFQEGMIAITRYVMDDVVKRISIPSGPRHLLDLGGGHAMYSIALCKKYPQLSAVILDGAQALSIGQETVTAEGMAERVTTREGSFLTDELGTGFDIVLLFNIVHGMRAEQNRALLRKVKSALKPGGQVIIMEQIAGMGLLPIQETTVRILGMSYFHLLGGQVYTFDDIEQWLTSSGFGNIQRHNIFKAGSPLIAAEATP
jgi:hypothetical protein